MSESAGWVGVRSGAVSCSEVTAVSAIAGSWVGIWSWAGEAGVVLEGETGAG